MIHLTAARVSKRSKGLESEKTVDSSTTLLSLATNSIAQVLDPTWTERPLLTTSCAKSRMRRCDRFTDWAELSALRTFSFCWFHVDENSILYKWSYNNMFKLNNAIDRP